MKQFAENTLNWLLSVKPFPQPPLIQTRLPIVFFHGFGLLGRLMKGGQLHEAAMHLRSHGVLAYAPNVGPYDTIHSRSIQWKSRLVRILEETGCDQVVVIAHSMGGLDARYLIHHEGFAHHIPLLVTLSTPHHGTSLAQYLLKKPDIFQKKVAEAANWMGSRALEDAEADFLDALKEFTPEHVTTQFNPTTPNHPEVAYWSYAGSAGKDTGRSISPFFRWTQGIIAREEGANDGLVSVQSARWGDFKGVLEADHAQQIGIDHFAGDAFDANSFYATLAQQIGEAGY